MHRFANPGRFMRVADRLQPWLLAGALGFLLVGLYKALLDSPPDYQQHDTVRILYIHVPAALLSQGAYIAMALGSATFLIWKHPLGDLLARSAAPIGAALALICLVTGAVWGKPTWGTYWVWDARLTSMLILFFLFVGYMALANAFDDPARGDKPAAILAVVGIVNIPIIKFSVYFFNTLHQQSTLMRRDGPSMPAEMLTPLLLMFGFFTCLFLWLMVVRLRGEFAKVRLRAIRSGVARRADRRARRNGGDAAATEGARG
ncbi:MAG: heme ABC transporter permease [Marivibrio sp.]|uniref:heme ABC transporter permease n=1 Tax=Marivibrio sp. TaxID=2039719 RepID=UPI0032ECA3A7